MNVEIKGVIRQLQKKSDGSLTFAVAIACLEEADKMAQALEIIKNKKVDVKYLCYRAEFNVEKYNDNYIETLTKEEIDLLKEVLK